MYALITSLWYFLDLRCSLRADRKRVVDLLAAILCRRTRGSHNISSSQRTRRPWEFFCTPHSTHAVCAVCRWGTDGTMDTAARIFLLTTAFNHCINYNFPEYPCQSIPYCTGQLIIMLTNTQFLRTVLYTIMYNMILIIKYNVSKIWHAEDSHNWCSVCAMNIQLEFHHAVSAMRLDLCFQWDNWIIPWSGISGKVSKCTPVVSTTKHSLLFLKAIAVGLLKGPLGDSSPFQVNSDFPVRVWMEIRLLLYSGTRM